MRAPLIVLMISGALSKDRSGGGMKIGDQVLLDGKIAGTIRYIKGEKYGVYKHETGATHYYPAYRLTVVDDKPAEDRPQVGDVMRHKPTGRVVQLTAVGDKKALFEAGVDANGHPLLQTDELDAFERLQGDPDEQTAAQVEDASEQPNSGGENDPIHEVFGEAELTADEDERRRAAPMETDGAPRLCIVCGAQLVHRRADAKTCSAACRKRLHRRRDDLDKRYCAARAAIDGMLKYAHHEDMCDVLETYAGALNAYVTALLRRIEETKRRRDAAKVTDAPAAR
jgi:hypothetical protein